MEIERDEPLTPGGRYFLQPEMNQTINCAIAGKLPIDIQAVRAELSNSIMLKLPRFCSLLVKDRHGREHWRRTHVDIDRHLIILYEPVADAKDEHEDVVNDYLADLAVSSPLGFDKPLWEVHLLMAHNCAVFRFHHALGDGISLMSMLLSCCRRADDPNRPPTIGSLGSNGGTSWRKYWAAWRLVKLVWFTVVFVLELVVRSLWVKDKTTAISGGAGVELWARKLATAKFRIEDMKTVKNAVDNATINDVLFGVVSSGLSKYLSLRSTKAVQDGLQITGIATVNLRPQPGLQEIATMMKSNSTSWGNKFGVVLLPVYYQSDGGNPLQYVKRAKAMIDRKKQSLGSVASYKIGDLLMSCFGSEFVGVLNYRIVCNTTFSISNVVGPREEITLVGNPVTYIRVNTSSLPHAITMHMLSYAGRAEMQILVAKDIIPDPEVLSKCFEESLLEMKKAAMASNKA